MELRLPLEVSLGREATCRAVFGTWGCFPDDARASHCPFVFTSFTGWSSERCPGIGFLSRGDQEIGVLRNVEPPTRPDRKSTRLNSSHHSISYAVFCLKKKNLPVGLQEEHQRHRRRRLLGVRSQGT